MDVRRRIAQEAARPDRRSVATVQGAARNARGASSPLTNPRDDGTYWWYIGDPNITLAGHPYPLPG